MSSTVFVCTQTCFSNSRDSLTPAVYTNRTGGCLPGGIASSDSDIVAKAGGKPSVGQHRPSRVNFDGADAVAANGSGSGGSGAAAAASASATTGGSGGVGGDGEATGGSGGRGGGTTGRASYNNARGSICFDGGRQKNGGPRQYRDRTSDRVKGIRWSFVFDPAGQLCYYWNMVVSLAFLYNFWVIIYRFAFSEINRKCVSSSNPARLRHIGTFYRTVSTRDLRHYYVANNIQFQRRLIESIRLIF